MFMVPYGVQAISVVVAPGSGTKIATEEDLIGKSSAVEVSSYQMNWLKKLSDASAAKGGAAVEMHTFPTATNVVSALLAGQVDNALLVDGVARDLVARGRVKEVLNGLGVTRTALAFHNKTVTDAVVRALNAMRTDGSYQALFDKFGLTGLPTDQPLGIAGPGPA
jgi:polar amino acid transport system substrate-binding protein